jgi:hypothetical protein
LKYFQDRKTVEQSTNKPSQPLTFSETHIASIGEKIVAISTKKVLLLIDQI